MSKLWNKNCQGAVEISDLANILEYVRFNGDKTEQAIQSPGCIKSAKAKQC